MNFRLPYAQRVTKCPTCRRPWERRQFRGMSQREAALTWLLNNKRVLINKEVKRFNPGKTSDAWLKIVEGLKMAGIYSPITYHWDFRLEALCREARFILNKRNGRS